MKRILCKPRENWQDHIAQQGIVFSKTLLPDGRIRHYWREGAYYVLSEFEVQQLEEAAKVLFEMFIAAGDHIANMEPSARTAFMRDKMRIPEMAHDAILTSWNDEPPCQSVYGRYDFAFFDPAIPPKLYEFNAQTPTCLVEAAWAQFCWMQDKGIDADQWNAIWDLLIEAWKRNLNEIGKKYSWFQGDAAPEQKPTIFFAYSNGDESGEDLMNVSYLADACMEADYEVRTICVEDIKLGMDGRFYVPKDCSYRKAGELIPETEDFAEEDLEHLDICFFLYPWEFTWDGNPEWAAALFADMKNVGKLDENGKYVGGTVWFEAPYKMLWSTKAILPVLWELFKHDPDKSKYLIPAWFAGDKPASVKDYVRKPIFAREGGNVEIYQNGKLVFKAPGDYGSNIPEDYVLQEYSPPPEAEDHNGMPMSYIAGVWMIDGDPAGLGIREDDGVVTTNLGYFVPHIIANG